MNKILVSIIIIIIAILLLITCRASIENFSDQRVQDAIIAFFNNVEKPKFTQYTNIVSSFGYPHLELPEYYIYFYNNTPLYSGHFENIDIRKPFQEPRQPKLELSRR